MTHARAQSWLVACSRLVAAASQAGRRGVSR